MSVDSLRDLDVAISDGLGAPGERQAEYPGVPFEQNDDGTGVKPVKPNTRCYWLGESNQRQTRMTAPNATSKVRDSMVLRSVERRAQLLRVCPKGFYYAEIEQDRFT